jgi:(aminoalkyl)phosphonate N-acetyltransferase
MATNTSAAEDNLLIRPMSPNDAERAAELSGELGYPTTADAMHARLSQLTGLEDHIIYAACVLGDVAGWIDVGIVHHLQSPSYGEIGGLIVSSAYRGQRIGHKLVKAAEQWIAAKGLATILVRSQVVREAAHRFYLQQNFSHVKTSAVFTKSL